LMFDVTLYTLSNFVQEYSKLKSGEPIINKMDAEEATLSSIQSGEIEVYEKDATDVNKSIVPWCQLEIWDKVRKYVDDERTSI